LNPECHFIVGEGTPQSGGMCAHATVLTDGLAETGVRVHVWLAEVTELMSRSPDITIHRTLGTVSIPDLWRTGRALNRFKKARLLIYWVPHAFGLKSMNVPFCIWLWFRSMFHRNRVELLVQECFLDFANSWKQYAAAFVHRVMTIILLNAADHVWGALADYEDQLRPYALGKSVPFQWLPVPSNVAVIENPAAVQEIRTKFAPDGLLLGHFGTFGTGIKGLLEDIVPCLLRGVNGSLVLLGPGGETFRDALLRMFPDLNGRIHATGYLTDTELSYHLNACDVMIQPYPDGITGRRGSILAPLAHGRPIVTNASPRTETLWAESGAVIIAATTPAEFLNAVRRLEKDPAEWSRISSAARQTYLRYFEPTQMVQNLRSAPTSA